MRIFEGYLRGVNLGGWLSQLLGTDDAHFDGFITEEDIARIASWGLDHVRLPVDCDVVFADMGRTVLPRMEKIDQCLGWCRKHGLNLVLDLHKTYGYVFDQGETADPEQFFYREELQDAFVRIWETFAHRYAHLAPHIAFELLNEVTFPHRAADWNRIAGRTIAAIRAISSDVHILVGGTRYNSVSAVPELDAPADDHIVYNFHCYEPLVFTHQQAFWVRNMPRDLVVAYPDRMSTYAQLAQDLGMWQAGAEALQDDRMIGPDYFEGIFAPALKAAQERNALLYCGEYGVIDRVEMTSTRAWMQDIHSVFAKYGIGRALWTYRRHNFGLVDGHYGENGKDIVDCL